MIDYDPRAMYTYLLLLDRLGDVMPPYAPLALLADGLTYKLNRGIIPSAG